MLPWSILVALYREISPHTGTRAYVRGRMSAATSYAKPVEIVEQRPHHLLDGAARVAPTQICAD
jgi:hypothetical protein